MLYGCLLAFYLVSFIPFVCIVGSQFRSWLSLDSQSWRRIEGRLISLDSYQSSDSTLETSDKLATTLASIQEFMAGMSRSLDQIENSCQNGNPIGISTDETIPHASKTAQVFPLGTSHGVPFHLSDHCETVLPPAAIVSHPIVTTTNDTRLVEKEEKGKTEYQGEDQRSTIRYGFFADFLFLLSHFHGSSSFHACFILFPFWFL